MTKRIVVTGASGNVGVALIRRLTRVSGKYDVLALARNPPNSAVNVVGDGERAVEWKAADVCRDDLVSLFRGADAVVHLAWRFHPTRNARESWRDNVLGSERTFQAATQARVPVLVYACSVAPTRLGRTRRVNPTNRSTRAGQHMPSRPPHTGRQKSYVERLLDLFELRYDMRIVRLRSAFVFQRMAAPEQRRIFAGPFVPGRLLRKLPVLPVRRGLRIQTVSAG